jgi:hypothetical protein
MDDHGHPFTGKLASLLAFLQRRGLPILLLLALAHYGLYRLTYWTLGEVPAAALFVLLVVTSSIFLVLAIYGRVALAAILSLLLTLLVAPLPLHHGLRLHRLLQEAASAAHYAERLRIHTGRYPASLAGYTYVRETLRPYLRYRGEPQGFGIQISPDGLFATSYRCTVRRSPLTPGPALAGNTLRIAPCSKRQDWFFEAD